MTDPLSAGGLAISAVSLTFQLFSGCVKGYQLLSEANGMPIEYRYLRVRLQSEEHRLLDWAQVANLSEFDVSLSANVRLNRHLLDDILREKESLLLGFGKINHEYGLFDVIDERFTNDKHNVGLSSPEYLSRPSGDRSHLVKDAVKSKALGWIEKTKRYPRKLSWVVFDREKFERLLSKLTSLNDFMKGLLDSSQLALLHQVQQETHIQILQLNSKVDDLLQIVRAATIPLAKNHDLLFGDSQNLAYLLNSTIQAPSHVEDADRAIQQNGTFASLARFKALITAFDMNISQGGLAVNFQFPLSAPEVIDPKLDARQITLINPDEDFANAGRSEAMYNYHHVWIEWKGYEPEGNENQASPDIQNRVTKLAALLHDKRKPVGFLVPDCIGYYDDRTNLRFGFVFAKPWDGIPETPPVSLLVLFKDEKPPLTERVKLACAIAKSIFYIHSTNWLHKGLRSHNVVFFKAPDKADLSKPFLCGFDYARPAESWELTEKPPENPEWDIYRHPLAHGGAPRDGARGFKKLYDVYSVGVILIEIATWQPINKVLGILDFDKRTKPKVIRNAQSRLLNEKEHLAKIRADIGDIFADAIMICLRGVTSARETHNAVESNVEAAFYTTVVRKLESIVV